MAETQNELAALTARLERLERSNQRLRLGGLAVLALGFGCAFIGARSLPLLPQDAPAAATFTTVTARRFVLVDGTGQTRAELALGRDGAAALDFLDNRGDFAGDVSGQDLSLFGPGGLSGHGEVSLKAGKEPSLTLADQSTNVELSGGAQPRLILHGVGTWAELLGGPQSFPRHGTAGPALLISDANGFAAEIGAVPTETPNTGETQQTSAASIILWGKPAKDGTKSAIWRAP